MVKENELKLGVVLSYIVIALNMIIAVLYTPILTRSLGQSEYGLYSLISSIISYLTILDLGFGNAIIIYTTRYRAQNQKKEEEQLYGMFLKIYTIIGIIAGVIGIILYFNVANMFGNSMTAEEIEKAKILMLILILNLVITFPFSIFTSIITAYERFIFSKMINIIRIILTPMIMIPLLLNNFKSVALVIVITVLNIGTLLINMVYCFKKIKIKMRFTKINFSILKEIFMYSFFIFLNTIIEKMNWNIDQFILGSIKGTVEVALYSLAAQINTLYLNFSTAISGVMLPKITIMIENKEAKTEIDKLFIKVGRLQFLLLSLIITGFIIFGRQFMIFWGGQEYVKAYEVACILIIPVTIPLIQNLGISILQAKNKHRFRTVILFFIAILNVIISIPLAKHYGAIGSALGTSIGIMIGPTLIMNWYYKVKIGMNIGEFWRNIIKMSIPIGIVFLITSFTINHIMDMTKILNMGIGIIFYTIFFSVVTWYFVMNDYEKNLIKKPLKIIYHQIGGKKNGNIDK